MKPTTESVTPRLTPPAKEQTIDLSDDDDDVQEDDRYNAKSDYVLEKNEVLSSGSNTEDEIDRILKKNGTTTHNKEPLDDVYNVTTDEEQKFENPETKPGSTKPIEPLPDFYKNKKFYLSSNLGSVEEIKLKRFITAYGGQIISYSTDANFIISNYDKKVSSTFQGEVVRPLWVFECNDMECLLPTRRYKFD